MPGSAAFCMSRSTLATMRPMARSFSSCSSFSTVTGSSLRCRNLFDPAHVRPQYLGNDDAAVFLLVVLDHRNRRATGRNTGAVQGVHGLGPVAVFGVAPTCLHAARLEGLAVGDRGNLAVLALPRQPYFEVMRLRRAEADVTRAQRDDAIRQAEQLENPLGVTGHLLQRGIRIRGLHDLHHLDLVELMLADHAARVLAVGTRLGTEARRVRDVSARQRL